ncbi:MAG: NAD(P)-dependent glycerol-3-phosphate dehydrogenase [Elusimicrobia bacterium]|nr:NAD(P)-dependent glycerol-3-phosphate dehydrogenase [Elusimicrobiota bacterium]
MKEKICILGGGSWGATLAAHLADNGHDVSLWEYDKTLAERLSSQRTLSTLPQLRLPAGIRVTSDIGAALRGRAVVVGVTPSHTVRSTFKSAVASGVLETGALIVSAAKGLEEGSLATMSQIVREVFPGAGDIVILSGPSHAEEVSVKCPVAMVAASRNAVAAGRVRDLFASDTFRVYTSDDPLGVELGGSLKNVYAVACGVIDGLGLGDNTKAALMTRGLAEMTRLGKSMGASPVTFFGLSGLGDLIVTCTSRHSRNRLLGEKIGKGKSLAEALAEMTMVAEGVKTTKAAQQLAEKAGAAMPIVTEMHRILFAGKPPRESMKDLMSRQMRAEMEGIVV